MIGPLLALLCFAVLVGVALLERRRAQLRAFERAVQRIMAEMDECLANLGRPLVEPTRQATEAIRRFGEAFTGGPRG